MSEHLLHRSTGCMPSLLDANPLMVIAVSIVLLIATISIAASGVFLARKRAARRHRHGALPPMMVTGGRDSATGTALKPNGKEAVQVLPGSSRSGGGQQRRRSHPLHAREGRAGRHHDWRGGRAASPPHQAAGGDDQSHARAHAVLQEGRWRITNLSPNNPTLVNGQELGSTARTRLLDDGDMIQIGEMLLRFRAD